MTIKLRGVNVKDKQGNRFPVFIDYNRLTVDGEDILESNVLASHDDFYIFNVKVADSQILDVHVEWLPFNASSQYVNNEVEKLKKENKKLKGELNEITNSNYWKLISKLR